MSSRSPSKEDIFTFLNTGIELMKSDGTRKLLKQELEPGKKLIELQRQGWDPLDIDRDIGCRALDAVTDKDSELFKTRMLFVNTAIRTYLQSLEDKKPAILDSKNPMPRATILTFFDSCNTKLELPETQQMLADYVRDNKKVPNFLIIEMQKDQLEILGFERDHGCQQLSKVMQEFPDDKEMHQALMMWKHKAEQTCMMIVQAVTGSSPEKHLQQMLSGPEMSPVVEKAKKEIEKMTPLERGALLQKMEAKMQTIMKLPQEGREQYFKKLVEEDKLEIVKTQILMLGLLSKNKQDFQQVQHGSAEDVAAGANPGLKKMEPPSVAPPSQQMM